MVEAGTLPRTGDAIRLLRERSGRSARALSAEAGLSPSYVGKIEHGECQLSLNAFAKLAVALGMTPFEVWVVVAAESRS